MGCGSNKAAVPKAAATALPGPRPLGALPPGPAVDVPGDGEQHGDGAEEMGQVLSEAAPEGEIAGEAAADASDTEPVSTQASKKKKKRRKPREVRSDKELGSAKTEKEETSLAPREKLPPRAASGAQWTGSKWMASLRLGPNSEVAAKNLAVGGSSILEVLTSGLREAPPSPEAPEFEALQALASDANLDEILTDCLRRAAPALKEILKDGLLHLSSPTLSTGKEFSEKYAGETFELSYGTLNRFFGGLESMVGRPKVPVLKAMFEEHCLQSDSKLDFTTSNYGVTTQSWKEFAFVFLGEVPNIQDEVTWERVEDIADELEAFDPEKEDEAALGKLPDPVKGGWLNLVGQLKALESSSDSDVSQKVPELFLVLEDFAQVHDRHARAELLRLEKGSSAPKEVSSKLKDPSKARQPLPLMHFRFEFWAMNKFLQLIKAPPLGVAEFVGVRLYTGPMFQKYNGVLRMFTGIQMMVDQWKRDCVDNKYTCTTHVINSALIKISKVQKAVKVFRGMSGGRLPTSFSEANAFGVKVKGGASSSAS